MLFESSCSRINSNSSSSSSSSNNSIIQEIPSTLIWSQTLELITLKINVNHVQVHFTERYLKLSSKSQTITLPLYSSVYIQKADIERMIDMNKKLNSNIIYLTLKKEYLAFWPHLLMQQSDEEVTTYLMETNFQLQIYRIPASPTIHYHDILDFDMVINGSGQKTGLE